MEQDRGEKRVEQPRKLSLGERWRNAQPTKAMAFWLCVASMILTMIVGFAWGGWVTGGTAQKMAETMTDDAIVTRLAPYSAVAMEQLDPGNPALNIAVRWRLEGRLAHEVMIEELGHAHGVVALVHRTGQPMVLADILEKDHFLAELSQGVVVRHALVEINGPILVVV